MKRHKKRFSWLWKILRVFSVLLVILIGLFLFLIKIDIPAETSHLHPSQYKRTQVNDTHFQVGNNWLKKNKYGIWEMYLEGDAFERGVIYGVLAKELIEKQEVHFVNQINEIIPNVNYQQILKFLIAWFNKDLDKHIPVQFQQEIYGVSLSFSDKYDYIAPKYYRILNYHAAHDIGHALNDYNLVGCTSFAVKNEYSEDGKLLIGRNFDFYMGDKFAEDKLLVFVNPTEGYKYSSYAWAGLTGVVSGMNEHGLTVTINASKSDVPTGAKVPISLLAREVLQYAQNIDEAIEIVKKRDVFVSESLLVGSATDKKAVIIEKSPNKMDVFQTDSSLVQCTNHYQSPLFKNDPVNIQNIEQTDTYYRYQRLGQLINDSIPLTPSSAASILRNQKGVNNADLGLGNPKAINQLIAHHSIIFKPEEKLFWVSSSPYQLGAFQCFDFDKMFTKQNQYSPDSLIIPSDNFLKSEAYDNYEKYKQIKQGLVKYLFLGIPFDMDKSKEKAFISYNPTSYLTYKVLGDYYYDSKQKEKAKEYYQTSLQYEVASEQEKESIKEKINLCQNNE